MRAYHIRTAECDPYSPRSRNLFILDYVFVPDKDIVKGFINLLRNEGSIVDYSDAEHLGNAQKIIEGLSEGKKGIVMGLLDLNGEVVARIAKVMPGHVRTRVEYDGSSRGLVDLLQGHNLKKGVLGKIRDAFWRICG